MTDAAEHAARRYPPALTEAQAQVALKYAIRGEVAAFEAGLGSNGYPPGEDAWLLLTSGRSVWVAPDGTERAAS